MDKRNSECTKEIEERSVRWHGNIKIIPEERLPRAVINWEVEEE